MTRKEKVLEELKEKHKRTYLVRSEVDWLLEEVERLLRGAEVKK